MNSDIIRGQYLEVPALRLSVLFVLWATSLSADIVLDLPVDCDLGNDCFIQYYMDRDQGEGISDYTGRQHSYDGHGGTDFRVISDLDMAAGVNVVAAAPGRVTATRDGMADVRVTAETRDDIAGQECGNGVVISHGSGWVTQYCHLRLGSIRVFQGQDVSAGEILGQIGLSGNTEFPHVHFSVRYQQQRVDPFDPGPLPGCATCTSEDLWRKTPAYSDTALMKLGFLDRVPEFDEIKAGTAHLARFSQSSPALVMWVHAIGKVPGDTITLQMTGPDGEVLVARDDDFDRRQVAYFRAVGVRKRGSWVAGEYNASAELLRDGEVIDRIDGRIVLSPER